ncbi:MAG: hypothetical protein J2P20_11455 [Pseudonocardia sp.]|nr:hypothetical protein [Pseudonocardia sp.]MBO0872693.1 hypothetical protein [Pseudonocardia sp.]
MLADAEDGGLADAQVSPIQADVSTREGIQQLWASVIGTGRPWTAWC